MIPMLLALVTAIDLPKPSAAASQMVFFRSGTLAGSAISCAVHENGAKLTSLHPGHYAVLSVEPRPHDYVVASEARDTYKVDAQPGQTYFVKCTVGVGFMAGHPHLNASSESEFDRMGAKFKPVDGEAN